jgi:hypothetical protein
MGDSDENTRIAIVNDDKVSPPWVASLTAPVRHDVPVGRPRTAPQRLLDHTARTRPRCTAHSPRPQCKPKKCRQECKRTCPVVRMGA